MSQAPREGRRGRLLRAVAAATLAVGATTVVSAAPAAARRTDQAVSMSVLAVTPSTPTASAKLRPLTIELSLTNMTDAPLQKVAVTGLRGGPLTSPAELDDAIATPRQPNADNPITTRKPVTVDLAPGATQTVEYRTTSSVSIHLQPGVCICTQAGVYTLYFTASAAGQILGTAQTFLPAFYQRPPTEQVTWLWPLIDRPHRLQFDDVFLDDDLAASVAGGRLDHALQALEDATSIRPDLAMTLVIDPELLSELQVMTGGRYRVQPPGKAATAGTGGQAAAAWLVRLRDVLATDPSIEVVLTPFADPDYDTVVRNDLPWSANLTSTMRGQVAAALNGPVPTTTLAWPAAGTLHAATAAALADAGVHTLFVSSNALPASALPPDGAPVTVTTKNGRLTVLHADRDIAKVVIQAMSVGGAGDAALPQLLAQLATRVTSDVAAGRTGQHQVLLVPPRNLDIAPGPAARTMVATAAAPWTRSAALSAVSTSEGKPVPARTLVPPRSTAPGLSPATVAGIEQVRDALPALTSMLPALRGQPTNALVASLPPAMQRLESSAWTADPAGSEARGRELTNVVTATQAGVFIVKPSRPYTLASNSAPLPLTVENDLDYPVDIVIHIESMNSLPGFHAKDVAKENLPAHSKTPIKVRTTLDRSGRIQVQATLRTPSGAAIGDPVRLSIRTTSLGLIGVVITIASGTVLGLALLRRFWQRYRHRGAPPPKPTADLTPIPQTPVEPAR